MIGHSGANTGGLQTSALATGLASAAVEYLKSECQKRPDLGEPTASLRDEHAELEQDLFSLAAGTANCSSEDVRARANSLASAISSSNLVRRQRHRLRRRPPRRPLVPRSAVLPGLELPARRHGRQLVRTGRAKRLNIFRPSVCPRFGAANYSFLEIIRQNPAKEKTP